MGKVIQMGKGSKFEADEKCRVARLQFVDTMQKHYVKYLVSVLAALSGQPEADIISEMTPEELRYTIQAAGVKVTGFVIPDIN